MKTIYQVSIRRDAQTITPVTVPSYELPVLQHIFGEENVTNHGVAGQWQESADEFDRLGMKYGFEVVEKVFGTKASRGLDGAIRQAEADESNAQSAKIDIEELKDSLVEQAKALGIPAAKTWGTVKLQAAIDAKLAE